MPTAASPTPSLRFDLAAAMLREGRTVELPATGTSMRPLIPSGGIVRVEPARAADVRPGDVVLVETCGRLICHRLLYVAAGRAVTRGDDVIDCDAPLPADAIIGRVAIPPSPHALLCAVRALLR